jgi:hypothetical protein
LVNFVLKVIFTLTSRANNTRKGAACTNGPRHIMGAAYSVQALLFLRKKIALKALMLLTDPLKI